MQETVIVSDLETMSGIPCFRGTRVPLKNLTDYLDKDYPLDEFLTQFPSVNREMAIHALEEAKDLLLVQTS